MDVAATPEVIIYFTEVVRQGARSFKIDPDESIVFECRRLDILVKLEILEIGGLFVGMIGASEPFLGGFLASLSDLFLLRAETVVGRSNERDVEDFKWLLGLMVRKGTILPVLGAERAMVLVEAARVLTLSDQLLLSSGLLCAEGWAMQFLI
jgi:hypothetical protein